MDLIFSLLTFVASGLLLYLAGNWLVVSLMRLARLLQIQEFTLAFLVMALAASIPNLFVGVTSALTGRPELSLGDIFGNNIIAMTVAVAVAVFFSPRLTVEAEGKILQSSILATALAAVLPLLLLLDGILSRFDGLILIGFFLFYLHWILSRRRRFSTVHESDWTESRASSTHRLKTGVKDSLLVVLGVVLFIVAALGIVQSASFFASYLGIPLFLVGLLVVGFGNALPETVFSAISARRGETALILGNITGSVIFPATLVLGLIVLIHPIVLTDLGTIAGSRLFLLFATLAFLIFSRTKKAISALEAGFLLIIYLGFVASVIL